MLFIVVNNNYWKAFGDVFYFYISLVIIAWREFF